ncbi:PREDICTED: transketolase-like [Nanorana parkeri]|uniref:transketolase-like n=1 Tax=Nanorana parkeri TaxID=125878 RepID=UPI0008547064|nr:PREDICTED: transketolase-like [Nanorana parkeri]
MSVLFFNTMKYKPKDPKNPNNDRFVMSKRQAFTDVATGSLGQGLGAAAGMAYTGKYFDKASYRVYCLLGDGETSEGSVWEAMNFAGLYKLDNLVAIIDVNRLGQSDPAPLQHKVEVYQKRCEAFGWNAVVVDGHSVEELCKAFTGVKNQPTAIIAKTFKGKGIAGVEDKEGWHGKPLPKDLAEKTIKEIESKIQSKKKLSPALPVEDAPSVNIKNIKMLSPPNFKLGDKIATRKAYGLALAKLGHASDRVIALDGDTKNSTFSELFKKEHPDRFIECYIAEQNMVSVAVGSTTRDRTVAFASAFATFFTRAFDQIRMAAISESNINLCGSHCGVSIGEDGASQMGLEDLTMFRVVPNATVFYPSDAVSTEKAVELAANTKGICFIRTSRPENAVIYNNNEEFKIGQAKVVKQSKEDQVTVIGSGVTLHEALSAAEQLNSRDQITIRIIDLFTIKPLDRQTILDSAKATKGRIITVEDHYYEGGIGEAVASAMVGVPGITVKSLAVSGVPRSGKPEELLKMFGIDKDAIVEAVKKIV